LRKKSEAPENHEVNYESIVEDLERSFSSLQSINSAFAKRKNNNSACDEDNMEDDIPVNEQFQAIQLAQILEKTAFELRVYSRRRNQKFKQQQRFVNYLFIYCLIPLLFFVVTYLHFQSKLF